ncbi:hypothetical protein FO519_002335 [Halicephalobus sp. NKZ332]|nr:hypothetical protein FO519_002335 [Halicephalobus sp. NKZ332]
MSNNSVVPVPQENSPNAEVLEQLHRLTAGFSQQQAIASGVRRLCTRVKELIDDVENIENQMEDAEAELIELAETILEFSDAGHGLGFCKLGGLESIKSCLGYPSYAVKATYLDVLANLSQNNEEVQNFIYANSDFIGNFVKAVVDDNLPSIYRAKLLLAISSLVRGNAGGRKKFFDQDGVKALEQTFSSSFSSGDIRVASKTVITAFHIYSDSVAAGDSDKTPSFLSVLKQMKEKLTAKSDKYKAVRNANQKLKVCCARAKSADKGCKRKFCDFDYFSQDHVLNFLNTCTPKGSTVRDIRVIKACMPYCKADQPPPTDYLKHLFCLQAFNPIRNCFRDYLEKNPNIFGDT